MMVFLLSFIQGIVDDLKNLFLGNINLIVNKFEIITVNKIVVFYLNLTKDCAYNI